MAAPARALGLALALDAGEVAAQHCDSLAHAAPVDLELGLARAARADAARLALEVLPQAGEARQHVLELGELDLEAGLAGARAARKDVEDQLGAVDDLDPDQLLEIPHLGGGEVVVEDDHVGVGLADPALELLELAAADEGGGPRRAAALEHRAAQARARGLGEPRQLLERGRQPVTARCGARVSALGVSDQHGALDHGRPRDLVSALQPRGSMTRS